MAAHRKVCARCQRVKDDPYAYCDEGWGLAKAETAARYARWKLDQPPGDDQGTLF